MSSYCINLCESMWHNVILETPCVTGTTTEVVWVLCHVLIFLSVCGQIMSPKYHHNRAKLLNMCEVKITIKAELEDACGISEAAASGGLEEKELPIQLMPVVRFGLTAGGIPS